MTYMPVPPPANSPGLIRPHWASVREIKVSKKSAQKIPKKMKACVCVCMCRHMHVYMYIPTYTHTHTHTHVHIYIICIHTCTYLHMHMPLHTHTHTYIYIYTYARTCRIAVMIVFEICGSGAPLREHLKYHLLSGRRFQIVLFCLEVS